MYPKCACRFDTKRHETTRDDTRPDEIKEWEGSKQTRRGVWCTMAGAGGTTAAAATRSIQKCCQKMLRGKKSLPAAATEEEQKPPNHRLEPQVGVDALHLTKRAIQINL